MVANFIVGVLLLSNLEEELSEDITSRHWRLLCLLIFILLLQDTSFEEFGNDVELAFFRLGLLIFIAFENGGNLLTQLIFSDLDLLDLLWLGSRLVVPVVSSLVAT